jgi:uncharacterized membrane protein YhhN
MNCTALLANTIRGITLSVLLVLLAIILHAFWQRHQNLKKPCIPYHAGMTLEPGQCATMEMDLRSTP